MSMEHIKTVIIGVTGTTAGVGGALFSLLAQVEQWLRICSLVVGITVGVLTLVTLVKRIRKE